MTSVRATRTRLATACFGLLATAWGGCTQELLPSEQTNTLSPNECGKSEAYTAIWDIQGSGASSPLTGTRVTTRGIVTANFQYRTGGPYEPRGFFVQAHEPDCDTATSDGVFVFTGTAPKTITVGDLVEIGNATVSEYRGPASFIWNSTLTQLSCSSSTCTVTPLLPGYGVPTPEEYDPPTLDAEAALYNEAREGMLVQVSTDATVVAPANSYDEVTIVRGTGLDRVHRDNGSSGQLIVVDGDGVAAAKCGQNGLGYIKTFDTIKYSPSLAKVAYGPLNYNFNTYKIQQDDDTFCLDVIPGNDSSYDPADNPPPAASATTLTVAGMNAYNLFDTQDDPNKTDDLPSQAEYDRKITKLTAAICNANGLNQPLVIGLQEVENDAVLQRLAGSVKSSCGADYAWHTLGGPDNRSIQIGFLTRKDRVTVMAVDDIQGCTATNRNIDYETGDHLPSVTCSGATPYYLFSRPPLYLQAQVTLGGQTRTLHVISVHFKSKLSSSSCSTSDCTDWRVEEARWLDSEMDRILASNPNALIAVTGDFNDFFHSDPLDQLDKTYGVLNNVWADLAGPPSTGQGTIKRYSYIYNGVAQTLDHMLVSDALHAVSRVTSPRHLNTDWPGTHETDTSMLRCSDHDFLLVGFDFPVGTPGDTNTAPSARVTSPTSGATVSGNVTIQLSASDAQDAAGTLNVQVAIDAGPWQTAVYNAATGVYELGWDTAAVANGSHTIDARATDSGGFIASAAQVSVNVSNSGGGGGGGDTGRLLISEVLYDPSGSEPGNEWIELYNAGSASMDISGYRLGDEEMRGSGEGMMAFPAGTSIGAGQVLIVANRASDFYARYGFYPAFEMQSSVASVPDMQRDTTWASGVVNLGNDGDEVLLLDASYAVVDTMSYGTSNWAFNPDAPDVVEGHSLARCSASTDTNSAADWVDLTTPTPGAACS